MSTETVTQAHSPGPWRVVERAHWFDVLPIEDSMGAVIAEAKSAKDGVDSNPTADVAEANARLIAAAPKMLEVIMAHRRMAPSASQDCAICALADELMARP